MSAKTGRRPKLNKAKIDAACRLIRNGNGFEQSCKLSGIGMTQAYMLLRETRDAIDAGFEPDKLGLYFLEQREQAEAGFEQHHIANINQHSIETWQASAWMLERKFPERYGRQRLEITGADGGAVKLDSTAKVVLYLPENGRDS